MCGEGLTLRLIIGHVPEEFGFISVPLHRIQIPALQVIFTTEGHRVIDVSRGRYFQTHHLQAPSTCREKSDRPVTWQVARTLCQYSKAQLCNLCGEQISNLRSKIFET